MYLPPNSRFILRPILTDHHRNGIECGSGNTVRNIIKNTIYKGQRKWNDITVPCPEIFTEDYWQEVNDNLKNNYNTGHKTIEHHYLLKGLLRCERCGRNYYGRINVNNGDSFYMCSSKRIKGENCGNWSIGIDMLESLIWSWFMVQGKFEELVVEHFESNSTGKEIERLTTRIDHIKKTISKHEKQLKQLLELTLEGVMDKATLKDKNDAIVKEKAKQEKELRYVQKELSALEDSSNNLDEIIKNVEKLTGQELTDKIAFQDRQKLLKQYIKNIFIEYNDIGKYCTLNINFNIPGIEPFTLWVSRRTTIRKNEEPVQYKRLFIEREVKNGIRYGVWLLNKKRKGWRHGEPDTSLDPELIGTITTS